MKTSLIIVYSLVFGFISFFLIRSGIKRKKFLKSLEIGSYVNVFDEDNNDVFYCSIKEISREDEMVLLSNDKTYSFNDLLD